MRSRICSNFSRTAASIPVCARSAGAASSSASRAALLETASAYRIVRSELARYYGSPPENLRKHVIPITGLTGKLRDLCHADGYKDEDILNIPDIGGGRYSVFTAVGLLPAAIMGIGWSKRA